MVNRRAPDLFNDDMESGDANWSSTTLDPEGPPDDWAIVASPETGSLAWFSANGPSIKDVALDTIPQVIPGPGAILRFVHRVDLQARGDGCILEASVDGGPFQDLGPQIIQGRYQGVVNLGSGTPLEGRPAWTGLIGEPVENFDEFLGTADLPSTAAPSDVLSLGATPRTGVLTLQGIIVDSSAPNRRAATTNAAIVTIE